MAQIFNEYDIRLPFLSNLIDRLDQIITRNSVIKFLMPPRKDLKDQQFLKKPFLLKQVGSRERKKSTLPQNFDVKYFANKM